MVSKRKISGLLLAGVMMLSFSACSSSEAVDVLGSAIEQASTSGETDTSNSSTMGEIQSSSAGDALAANKEVHQIEASSVDESTAIEISLDGESITADDESVSVDGNKATITSGGTYSLSGTLTDGQIIVDTQDERTVTLILNGANLTSTTSAPIDIKNAEAVLILLSEGTENTLSDGTSYVFAVEGEDEPTAALFSAADLTISGNGSLTVNGNYNDGISSKDGLVISGGSILVNAVDDGIRGKDYLVIEDGNITVNAQGDGLKSDNDEDATRGYVSIENGTVSITAGGDAISAATDVVVTGGVMTLVSGGGSSARIAETLSAKGIKGVVSVSIDGGSFTIDSADDTIHSNGSIVINNGTFLLTSGDDGLHADSALEINDGEIEIAKSYEGIESAVITINGGDIEVNSSDDGINVAGGNDGSGFDGNWSGGPGQDIFASSGDYYLYINGGYIVVNAYGDGLDSNGSIEMTDGTVLVSGPTENMNGTLDYMGTFNISGGLLIGVGSSGMLQGPSTSSSQYSIVVGLGSTVQAGTLIHLEDEDGNSILTFSPAKNYQSIVISSPDLKKGTDYSIYLGGSSTGTETDGLWVGGSYTLGTLSTSLTLSDIVTSSGTFGFGGPGGGGMRPGGGRP